MRRLIIVALVAVIGWLPMAAQAQTPAQASAPASQVGEGSDYGVHPALAVFAGAVSGVVIASAVAGSLVVGSLLLEGGTLAESLEAGTGLSLPAIGASAVLGGLIGHLAFTTH